MSTEIRNTRDEGNKPYNGVNFRAARASDRACFAVCCQRRALDV